jgi:vitamin-K-epoxide reductase (warfarin-sensitive)
VQPAVTDSAPVPTSEASATRGTARVLYGFIAVLSLAGVIVSAISLERHYAKSATAYCDFSQQFNCDIVNRSEYSTFMGIPVAAIGVAGYAALFVLATFWKSRAETPNRLLGAAITGLAFALYLTYIEAYELMTWCILCLASLALISLISAVAIVVKLWGARA